MKREPQIHHAPEGVVCTDEDIRREITERLQQAAHLDARSVSVDVQACGVILTGHVPDTHTRHAIEELVEACPGVQDVDNRLQVQPS